MAAAAGTGDAIVLAVVFPREQRQRAATIGKIPGTCDDSQAKTGSSEANR